MATKNGGTLSRPSRFASALAVVTEVSRIARSAFASAALTPIGVSPRSRSPMTALRALVSLQASPQTAVNSLSVYSFTSAPVHWLECKICSASLLPGSTDPCNDRVIFRAGLSELWSRNH